MAAATSIGYGTVYEPDGATLDAGADVTVYDDLNNFLGLGTTDGNGDYDIDLGEY